jgi:hypothetical protein
MEKMAAMLEMRDASAAGHIIAHDRATIARKVKRIEAIVPRPNRAVATRNTLDCSELGM